MDVACWVSQRIGLMLYGSTVSVLLAVRELAGKHNGKSMASILLEIIEEFKLQAKVSISWIGINFS